MRSAALSTLFLALSAAGGLTPEALAAAPRYRMKVDETTAAHGVQTISLVKNPAIQREWVALSAVETAKRWCLSEATEGQMKQVITGPALLPGQEILRLDAQGNPFYIYFDEETIELVRNRFAEQGLHGSTNQDHAIPLQGNTVVENWIIADPACDKALALGLSDLPAGTWMLSVRIPDSAYWLAEVVTGNKRGFSIEGLFDSEQLNLSAQKPTLLSSMFDWFKNFTAKLSADKVKEMAAALGLEQLADGRAVQIDDTTGAVCLCNPDGTPGAPLPDGTYPLQNGGQLVVVAGVRQDGDGQAAADLATDAPGDKQPATAAVPAPLAADAGLPELVAAVNGLIEAQKKPDAAPAADASTPAAPKLAALLHNVALADLGPKLAELKLDAIDLAEGDKLTYNPVSRRLSDSKGALVESGYYAAADGSYFQVSTDQYIWSIDKQTYDSVYKLAAVELQLAQVQGTTPAGRKVLLGGEAAAGALVVAEGTPTQKVALSATARLREMQESS